MGRPQGGQGGQEGVRGATTARPWFLDSGHETFPHLDLPLDRRGAGAGGATRLVAHALTSLTVTQSTEAATAAGGASSNLVTTWTESVDASDDLGYGCGNKCDNGCDDGCE